MHKWCCRTGCMFLRNLCYTNLMRSLVTFLLKLLFVTIASFVKLLYLLLLSVVWSYHICCYCHLCEAAIFVAIVSCVKLLYLLLSPFVWSYHIYCYCQMCEATIFVAVVSCVKLPYLLLLSVLWSYCICCYCHLCEATIFAALSVVWSYHIRQNISCCTGYFLFSRPFDIAYLER